MNNISKTPDVKPEIGLYEFVPLGFFLTTFITRLLSVCSKNKKTWHIYLQQCIDSNENIAEGTVLASRWMLISLREVSRVSFPIQIFCGVKFSILIKLCFVNISKGI